MRNRYTVQRCDEGGTLFRNDGTPVDHTWSVVDRQRLDAEGHPREVSNHDTRTQARAAAAELEAAHLAPDPRVWAVGDVVRYNDGRPGHDVRGTVVDVGTSSMVVHFDDRASPSWIQFTDRRWMEHLTLVGRS